MPAKKRRKLASFALGPAGNNPVCPFQEGRVRCGKRGGVCSIQRYDAESDRHQITRAAQASELPIATCPHRFSEGNLVPRWLASIVGFDRYFIAREVPFMRSPTTDRPAGRIDLVIANDLSASKWLGLEIQAVYFSGKGMQKDFELLLEDEGDNPPAPRANRRPDWRSSSAKRLMPQAQIKVPTLRRWGTKLAIAVDWPFFNAIGGASDNPSHDLDDGDVIWLVPQISAEYRLEPFHWEVLTLEDSSKKLLSAETVKRGEFEQGLKERLRAEGSSR